MADFVRVPVERVPEASLEALLEEFASRDGTDYGERETPLGTRVNRLRQGLNRGSLMLLFDADSQTWDVLAADDARPLLSGGGEHEQGGHEGAITDE